MALEALPRASQALVALLPVSQDSEDLPAREALPDPQVAATAALQAVDSVDPQVLVMADPQAVGMVDLQVAQEAPEVLAVSADLVVLVAPATVEPLLEDLLPTSLAFLGTRT